jgi:hypothetical protein
MEAHLWAVEVYHGAVEPHPGALEADPGSMEAHTRNFAKLKRFSYKFRFSRNFKTHFRKHPTLETTFHRQLSESRNKLPVKEGYWYDFNPLLVVS